MKIRQNIDRLFREQFKDFESAPPPEVWNSISSQLNDERKNRKAIPVWYKFAGVAALLLVIFSVGNFVFTPDAPIVSDFDNDPKTEKTLPKETMDSEIIMPTPVLTEEETRITTTSETNTKNNSTDSKKGEIYSDKRKNTSSRKDANNNTGTLNSEESGIASASEEDDKTKQPSEKEKISHQVFENNKEVADKSIKKPEPLDILSEEDRIAEKTIAQNPDEKKSLLEYLKEKEETVAIEEKKDNNNRWEVAPNFAPVYYSSLGSGSSIDPRFSDNPKSGDVNYSYGVQVSYAINDKLSIRTGISRLDLSYSTNDIEFAASSQSAALKSINYNNRDNIVAIGPRGSLSNSPHTPVYTDDGYPIVLRSGVIAGSFTQQLDYFEIPMELKYSLIDARFGINMIGGVSTLLLGNNDISIQSEGFETSIGSANNLNDLSFTTNVGLGFNYKFTRQFIFNLEPMFKYQLNPYSDSSIDFKPYYLGIYSGLSFRF